MENENMNMDNTGMRRRRPFSGTAHSSTNSMEHAENDNTATTTTASSDTVRPAVPRRPQASPSTSTTSNAESSDPQQQQQQQQQQQSEQPQSQNQFAATTASSSPSSSLPHPASLSQGMMPLVQSALRRAAGTSSSSGGGGGEFVPPLHNYRLDRGPLHITADHGNNPYYFPADMIAEDPGATEFLSRLLLLLGSVVIFCLLLF
jgi:hypothetical protein